MGQGSRQPARRALDAEPQQHSLVDMPADQHESQNGFNHVRNGDRCHGELHPQFGGESRHHDAADAKPATDAMPPPSTAAPKNITVKINCNLEHFGRQSYHGGVMTIGGPKRA